MVDLAPRVLLPLNLEIVEFGSVQQKKETNSAFAGFAAVGDR